MRKRLALLIWIGCALPAIAHAGPQKDAVCQGGCGGGCGPCPGGGAPSGGSGGGNVNINGGIGQQNIITLPFWILKQGIDALSAEPPSRSLPIDSAAQQANALNRQGVAAFNTGDYTTAAAYFQQASARNPNSPALRHNLAMAEVGQGLTAYNKGEYLTAMSFFRQAESHISTDDASYGAVAADISTTQRQIDAINARALLEQQNTQTANTMHNAAQSIGQSMRAAPMAQGLDFADGSGTPVGPVADRASLRVITGINALAVQLEWSADKRDRLNKALTELKVDGDPDATSVQIHRTWQDILIRGQDAALVREASQGGGLGLPGAGRQSGFNDCTVFALANATGLPYGVVAARATELIRQGNWRSAAERANAQTTIEQQGLVGGEVIMLAEVFGQAEVVSSAHFAQTLAQGRPIMVNLVPADGNVDSGHQVVLTKTFQHAGETWYVMMDSNQGPQRPLFLSARELSTAQQENGVAFRPEPGTTPALLRAAGDQ